MHHATSSRFHPDISPSVLRTLDNPSPKSLSSKSKRSAPFRILGAETSCQTPLSGIEFYLDSLRTTWRELSIQRLLLARPLKFCQIMVIPVETDGRFRKEAYFGPSPPFRPPIGTGFQTQLVITDITLERDASQHTGSSEILSPSPLIRSRQLDSKSR